MMPSPDGTRWSLIALEGEVQSLKLGETKADREWDFGSAEGRVLSFHWISSRVGLVRIATPQCEELWSVEFSRKGEPSFQRQTQLGTAERFMGTDGECFFTREKRDDREEIKVYELTSRKGERVAAIPKLSEDVVASRNAILLHLFRPDGSGELWRMNGGKRLLRNFSPDETFRIVKADRAGETAWILTNQGSKSGLTGLHLISLEDGRSKEILEDPDGLGDVVYSTFDPDGTTLTFVEFAHPRSRGLWKNKEWQAALHHFKDYTHARLLSLASEDATIGAVQARDSSGHPHFLIIDCKNRKILKAEREYPALKGMKMGRAFSTVVSAKGGVDIPTVVTLHPDWKEGVAAPTLVFPHGGPFIHTSFDFDPRVQFLASRGYVVLQPNYRGSTGFGQRHQNAARRNWGPDGIQQDLDAVADWAIAAGYADPVRIGIFGGSFGGFLALSTACFRAERYRCAAAFFAPSCMAELLVENPSGIAPSSSLLKTYFGDPLQRGDRKAMGTLSPRNGQPRIPLLIYHGSQDPLVKLSHAIEMVKHRVEASTGRTELLVDRDGRHGFTDSKTEVAAYTALEQFFAEHLGGRRREMSVSALELIDQWRTAGREVTGN